MVYEECGHVEFMKEHVSSDLLGAQPVVWTMFY